jgi:hypothetical protein
MLVPTFQKCNLDGLEHSFSPFRDIISENKTKQIDDINFHHFTISFNGLLEHFDVGI